VVGPRCRSCKGSGTEWPTGAQVISNNAGRAAGNDQSYVNDGGLSLHEHRDSCHGAMGTVKDGVTAFSTLDGHDGLSTSTHSHRVS
jgi:hypothetical protein